MATTVPRDHAAAATSSLFTTTVQQPRATINKIHILFHSIATAALLYYRISNFLYGNVPVLAWGLMTGAEAIFAFVWFLSQAFRWNPVARTVSLYKLPEDAKLPGVDVFICTADQTKEPTVEVMNTVISAMGLDYPAEKLAVYLSDDGGAASTLFAIKEACSFAKIWLPFCRQYGIKTRCPEAYFSVGYDEFVFRTDEFVAEEEKIQAKYEMFKAKVENRAARDSVVNGRPPCVEIINNNSKNVAGSKNNLPLLVYVSREKRPSLPHRFKAGALNALLRVSGILSNAPYMVVLDCDMYCNDPASAKQAMCFHLDSAMSNTLAYVQYPQIFYNVSKRDIYDGQARSAYKTKYQGMDGIGGTICAGTGYYLKKKALYNFPNQEDEYLSEPEKKYGNSSKFIASINGGNQEDNKNEGISSDVILEEARNLASCLYEENTQWGKEIGYSYDSLLESSFTGYLLHTRGWRSVYLYPKRPSFLGCTTIDMKDAMVQLMKWSSGLLQVGLSRFSPLVYGMSRMSVLRCMCYGYFMFMPFLAVACMLYGVVPQLCLLNGISLFPEVSSPWFSVFATVYISSTIQHLYEVLSSGGSVVTWWNETRIFFIKSVTALLFGCLDVVMKSLGVAKASFRLTNKAVDQQKLEKYENGTFDFEGAKMFMVPLTVLVLLNMICFIGGIGRVIGNKNIEEMFGQVFLSSTSLLFSYPILKGLIPSKSK